MPFVCRLVALAAEFFAFFAFCAALAVLIFVAGPIMAGALALLIAGATFQAVGSE